MRFDSTARWVLTIAAAWLATWALGGEDAAIVLAGGASGSVWTSLLGTAYVASRLLAVTAAPIITLAALFAAVLRYARAWICRRRSVPSSSPAA